MSDHTCSDCGESCEITEETFGYSGTHCTNGKDGVHHTGHYVSGCCGAELKDEAEEMPIFEGTRAALDNLTIIDKG